MGRQLFSDGSFRSEHGHLAGAAVETEGEAAAVVEEEQGTRVRGALVDGAHAQFVAEAVPGPHQFGAGPVGEFVSRFL